mgnify:FL=1|tara:strand:+ start:62 stop:430 length:369 start_codon:yes stop_codon:yes gene_type:complete
MTENSKEKKNVFSKIKESIDDKEEQMAFLGTLIRLGVMVWAGFIISLNYITLPGITEDREVKDITFIASVFTGCLASFNITPGGKKKKDEKDESKVASSGVTTQILRIEQAPIKIITDTTGK